MATVVLVHGLFGPFDDGRTASLLPGHDVVAPDLLGYGVNADAAGQDLHHQVEHLRSVVGDGPVHLVGHSVGGAVALLYADRFPEQVLGVVDIEGNFALEDAFWSARFAALPAAAAEALLESYRADPAGWVGGDPDEDRVALARRMLAFQPASTLQATAASVVAVTGAQEWEPLLGRVFRRTPVHLVAGERSRADWHVPGWALEQAASVVTVAGAGHMVMLDQPEALARTLESALLDS